MAGTPNSRNHSGARAPLFEPRHGEAPASRHVVRKPNPARGRQAEVQSQTHRDLLTLRAGLTAIPARPATPANNWAGLRAFSLGSLVTQRNAGIGMDVPKPYLHAPLAVRAAAVSSAVASPGMAACPVRIVGCFRLASIPARHPDRGHRRHPDRPGRASRSSHSAPRPTIAFTVRTTAPVRHAAISVEGGPWPCAIVRVIALVVGRLTRSKHRTRCDHAYLTTGLIHTASTSLPLLLLELQISCKVMRNTPVTSISIDIV